MTGDGVHAAFDRPLDALAATIEIQQALAAAEATDGLALPLALRACMPASTSAATATSMAARLIAPRAS